MMNLIRTWAIVPLAFAAGASPIACAARSPQAAVAEPARPTAAIPNPPQSASVQRGWIELSNGHAEAAEKLFEQALAQDATSTEARIGLIRSWIAEARINDAMNTIDKLDRASYRRSDIDYLYGMAFERKGREFIRQNVPPENIDMAFADAATHLVKATHADPDAYKDAYAALAESTWYLQDLDVARAAAERAIVLLPADAEGYFVLGRVALSQYVAMRTDETVQADPVATAAEAESHWQAARAAFMGGLDVLSHRDAGDAAATELKVRTLVELGHALAWKQDLAEAARAYGAAMEAAPAQVDFAKMQVTLGSELFAATLEEATSRFAQREPAAPADKALLLWWLGYARFAQLQFAAAEAAFVAAVELAPSYVNSWFYAALARYYQQNFSGAADAFLRNWQESPPDLVHAVQTNAERNLAILDALVGWCAEEERTLDAAVLSEIQAESQPEVTRYWNNAGLFYRDVGEALVRGGRPVDVELAREHFERAYKAYTSALALSPEDPAILNDTGVMLHYCLKRDFDQARELYRKANANAKTALARTDLDSDTRSLYETALRDSTNNLKLLDQRDAGKNVERPGGA